MLIEAILAYLGSIGGPDRETWRIWLGVVVAGVAACVLLAVLHVS
jgi:hypothetical protein